MIKVAIMDEKRPVFNAFGLVHGTNIEPHFKTHEYKHSTRIFGPIIGDLVISLLSLGKIHRPQLPGRVRIVLG